MQPARSPIAIVDDDAAVRAGLRRLAQSPGFEAVLFATGEALLESLQDAAPDCVILDFHLPGLRGFDLLRDLRSLGLASRVIVITGLDQPGLSDRCLRSGAAAYLTKPVGRTDLAQAIERIVGPS